MIMNFIKLKNKYKRKSASVYPNNIDNSISANRTYLMPSLSFKIFTALYAHYLMTTRIKYSSFISLTTNYTLIILIPLLIYI